MGKNPDIIRDNYIPDITTIIQWTEGKIFLDITILSVHSHNLSEN